MDDSAVALLESEAEVETPSAVAEEVVDNEPWLEVTCSPGLTRWMAEQQVSLACTTYQSGKLMLLGRKADGGLSVFERNFTRCMGLWGNGQSLLMSTEYQLWSLENLLRPGQNYERHDALFVPKVGTTTGDLDIHDVAIEASGRPIFAATGFNCLGTVNDRYSFTPLWKPPFISALAAEDRCHLNGLALENGQCRYVSAVAATDESGAWRKHRQAGGVVLEVPSGEVVATGLSMPHSPRVHHDQLWILNSGTGYFGKIDRSKREFEPLVFGGGYLRGLSFVGNHFAVAGLSRPRHDDTFGGLDLDDALARRGQTATCGLIVIDLRSNEIIHWVRFEGIVTELYDVVALQGPSRPMAFGFKADDIKRIIAAGDSGVL